MQYSNKTIGFVWIPKTGGTDLTTYFKEHYQNIILSYSHTNTGRDYTIPCFTILREPIEKFISAFKFLNIVNYRNKYKQDDENNINSFLDSTAISCYSPRINFNNINNFLDKISDNDLIASIFFKQQHTWLNNDSMYIVKYDSIDLYKNITEMLKHGFEIIIKYDNTMVEHERLNVSDSTGLQCELTPYNIERLQRLYKKDYDYYNIFNSNDIVYYQLKDFVI